MKKKNTSQNTTLIKVALSLLLCFLLGKKINAQSKILSQIYSVSTSKDTGYIYRRINLDDSITKMLVTWDEEIINAVELSFFKIEIVKNDGAKELVFFEKSKNLYTDKEGNSIIISGKLSQYCGIMFTYFNKSNSTEFKIKNIQINTK